MLLIVYVTSVDLGEFEMQKLAAHRVDERIPWIFALPVVVYKCVHILRHSEMSCNTVTQWTTLRYSISLKHLTVWAHFLRFFLNWLSIFCISQGGTNSATPAPVIELCQAYYGQWGWQNYYIFCPSLKWVSHMDSVSTDEVLVVKKNMTLEFTLNRLDNILFTELSFCS